MSILGFYLDIVRALEENPKGFPKPLGFGKLPRDIDKDRIEAR